MRSLDSGIGAEEFAAGMQTYYNYIRPHQGIGGMVPASLRISRLISRETGGKR